MTKGSVAYSEMFPAGSRVQICGRAELEYFEREWKLHNPLQVEQLGFADRISIVESVGFYHGGDALYQLRDVPGIWHEVCLRRVDT
jgi:hypothetical protein